MPERILVIRMKAIGDVMFTRPALVMLRDAYPAARISYLTGAVTAPLVRGFAEVDEVLVFDRRTVGWDRPWSTLRAARSLWRRLRASRFDLSIDLHGNSETALAPWLARIPERWGWSVGKEYRQWYTRHESVEARPGVIHVRAGQELLKMHPADWHVEFLRRCGVPPTDRQVLLKPDAGARQKAAEFLAKHGFGSGTRVLFFQPFSSSDLKDWPIAFQLEVAGHWKERGFAVVFGGSPDEVPQLKPVVDAGYPVAAGLDLMAMTALMTHCALCVGPDTGLIHLAHAAGARVLDLRRYKNAYPHRHPERAITAPGEGPVRDISVAAVKEAMERLLANPA